MGSGLMYSQHQSYEMETTMVFTFLQHYMDSTKIRVLTPFPLIKDELIESDAKVLLGTSAVNQTEKAVRVITYTIEGKTYHIATDRFDLDASQIAEIYRLRWSIESFFKWWKKHLKVYHLIARSEYGMMVQILAGLISYLLMAIYCHEEYGEKVSIARIRELRTKIFNELCGAEAHTEASPTSENAAKT